jgi:hypothetical protein
MSKTEDDIQDVLENLSLLSPSAGDASRPTPEAMANLKQRLLAAERQSFSWRITNMLNRKYVFATVSLILLFVIALSFPGVRAAASDFLGLFRVDKFAPISISPEQIALLEEIAESGLYPGEIQMIEEPGEPQYVGSLSEAEDVSGMSVRRPGDLEDPDSIYAMSGGSGRLIVDVENARAILGVAGVDPALIPDSLDQATVEVTVFPSVSQNWNEGIVLLQSPSPEIQYPDDVDISALGSALLQVLGMEQAEADNIAANFDWTSTLLVPIPKNMASFNEVRVDGEVGLALSSLEGNNSGLIWQRDGVVYVLSGADTRQLIDVANSLQ